MEESRSGHATAICQDSLIHQLMCIMATLMVDTQCNYFVYILYIVICDVIIVTLTAHFFLQILCRCCEFWMQDSFMHLLWSVEQRVLKRVIRCWSSSAGVKSPSLYSARESSQETEVEQFPDLETSASTWLLVDLETSCQMAPGGHLTVHLEAHQCSARKD